MKILIAFCSRYGAARRCASLLAERITVPADVVDLGATRRVDLALYDVVVLGGSVYGGRIQRRLVSFCDFHEQQLMKKEVGVYLCCLYQGERAVQQLHAAYPAWLLAHSFHSALPGGELRFGDLRWIDRLAVRGLPHSREDMLLLKTDAMDALAAAVNEKIMPS